MSFDVNPIGDKPKLRTAKSQDGGAGNTGYFANNRKKKESENSMNKSVFGDTSQDTDTFTLEDAEKLGVKLFDELGVKTLEEARKLDAQFIRNLRQKAARCWSRFAKASDR